MAISAAGGGVGGREWQGGRQGWQGQVSGRQGGGDGEGDGGGGVWRLRGCGGERGPHSAPSAAVS